LVYDTLYEKKQEIRMCNASSSVLVLVPATKRFVQFLWSHMYEFCTTVFE